MQALEQEIKELIISALSLEDVAADDIDASAPLFGAALHNVRSHLAKLGDEGLVCRDASGCWSAVPRRVGA